MRLLGDVELRPSTLINPAHPHQFVLVRTCKFAGRSMGVLENYPGDSETIAQAPKIGGVETVPAIASAHFPLPIVGKSGEQQHDAGILNVIRHHAALRQGAEAMFIFFWTLKIVGIQREISVN